MTNVLLGLVFFTVALVCPEFHSLGSSPTEPELSTTERNESAALLRAPLPYDINIVMAQMALAAFGIGSGPFDEFGLPKPSEPLMRIRKSEGSL